MNRQSDMGADRKADSDRSRVPDHSAEVRDEIVQQHRERRETEPAAAPMMTDAEAGGSTETGAAPLIPEPATQPTATHAVRGPQSDPSDVKAGPGDAGGQRSPRISPRGTGRPQASRRAMPMLFGLIALGFVIWALIAWL